MKPEIVDQQATAARTARETVKTRLAESRKRREAIEATDAEMDRVMGRVIRWTNKLADLRDKRRRQVRALAKYIAANS